LGANHDDKRLHAMIDGQFYEIFKKLGESSRGRFGGLDAMVLTGTYEEIGKAHGVLAGQDILDMLDSMVIPLVNNQKPEAWDSYLIPQSKRFLFPQPYEKEMEGILQGIKEKYPNTIDRTLAVLKREITIDDLRVLNCFIDLSLLMGACSSFCAWGSLTADGEVICGRNLDERVVPNYKPVFMIVARKPMEMKRMATIDVSGPGLIGVSTSINEDGVILMGHDEKGLESRVPDKLTPRSIVLREAIETIRSADTPETINKKFEKKTVKSGNNVHIARPCQVADWPAVVIEWDANPQDNGVTCRFPDQPRIDSALVCTNHFVKRRSEPLSSQSNSIDRYRILQDYLSNYKAWRKVIGVTDAVKMMHAVSVSDTSLTYCSVIAFPSKKELHIAVAPKKGKPATLNTWTIVTWDALFRGQAS